MENINEFQQEADYGAPRCCECNRLYKKTNINQQGLCPKCLAKTVDTEITELSEVLLESQITPEFANIENFTLKAGQVIRSRFMELINEGKITKEYIFELSTKEGTTQFFGVRYPFLKEFNHGVPIKELTYVKGHARYSSKPVTIGAQQYLITNDLYKTTVPKFFDWAQSLSKGIEDVND